MATYSRRERVTRTVEYVVPAAGDGAGWSEVTRAVMAIHEELADLGHIERHSNDEPRDAPDDMIRIRPDGDEIVVSYIADDTEREAAR